MVRAPLLLAGTAALFVGLVGCDQDPEILDPGEPMEARSPAAGNAQGHWNVVEVIARHRQDVPENYEFVLSTHEIPSGWTTFEFDNRSGSTHFGALQKVPDEALVAAGFGEEGDPPVAEPPEEVDPEVFKEFWVERVPDPFQDVWDEHRGAGAGVFIEELVAALTQTAPWFLAPGLTPSGGPGFTQGHVTSETAVYLEPGVYVIECYVLDGDDRFHTASHDANGAGPMLEVLIVTGEESGAPEPRPTLEVRISTDGIDAPGFDEVRPGKHTVAVHFEDQDVYGHLLGHDVHLIRLEDGTTVTEVNDWMSWLDPDGLVSSSAAPGPSTFIGGAQTATAGSTAYVHVTLTPGDYAWVAEVPNPEDPTTVDPVTLEPVLDAGSMLKEFTVPFGRTTGRR